MFLRFNISDCLLTLENCVVFPLENSVFKLLKNKWTSFKSIDRMDASDRGCLAVLVSRSWWTPQHLLENEVPDTRCIILYL